MVIDLETIRIITQIFQSFVTTFALILGSIWSYSLFIRKRQIQPRANITHKITAIELIEGKKLLVHVAINIVNQGDVLIRLSKGAVRIEQVIPLAPELQTDLQKITSEKSISRISKDPEIDFSYLGDKEMSIDVRIEPHESDEIYFDFVINSDVKIIKIYSHLTNRRQYNRSTSIGWNLTTFYDLRNSIKFKEI